MSPPILFLARSVRQFCVRLISFEPLVGFTNISAQMSSMMSQCAVLMFDQGRVKVIVQGLTWYDLVPLPSLITLTTILNKLPPFPCCSGWGIHHFSLIALVYNAIFLYKNYCFHPVTYGGRHDWFHFRKHPSSLICDKNTVYHSGI